MIAGKLFLITALIMLMLPVLIFTDKHALIAVPVMLMDALRYRLIALVRVLMTAGCLRRPFRVAAVIIMLRVMFA